ncbi:MAG: relaxase [Piscirickettsiaceae bacterium]|nr:MAG: relaxase [Piscirickettsiaceae bacterium]
MILKASKRGGARQLARHLLNGEKNEHVTVHEVSGFASDTIGGALDEIHAISKGTRCTRFMFSLSLSPPENENVPTHVFEEALERIEKKLGFEGQPRVVVFHEKNGRRHAHCVWSRINADEMKAIDQPYFKNKLNAVAKQLYLDHGWKLPEGFIDRSKTNPLNYTRAEWEQAARTNQNPKTIKAALQECWAMSDNRKSFSSALKERGYYLAKGDRRGYVVVNIHGEVYSLTRQIGVKKKELEGRIGKAENLPSVDTVKNKISGKVSTIFIKFLNEQNKDYQKLLKPLLKTKQAMTKQHRKDRVSQKSYQGARWIKEDRKRVAKIRRGFKGLWDKLTGVYWKQRKINEQETSRSHKRDQNERDKLIQAQLNQRQKLQEQLIQLQKQHVSDRANLIKGLSHMTQGRGLDKTKHSEIHPETQKHEKNKQRHKNPEPGIEPEI